MCPQLNKFSHPTSCPSSQDQASSVFPWFLVSKGGVVLIVPLVYSLSFLTRHSNSLARLCGYFRVGTGLSARGKGRDTPKWRYLLACREGDSYRMGEVLTLSGEGANSASTGIKICRANVLRDIHINDSLHPMFYNPRFS